MTFLRRHAFLLPMSALLLCAAAGAQQTASGGDAQPAAKRPSISERDKRSAEKSYIEGAKSLEHDDSRAAYASFTRAVELDPENKQYAAAKEVSRQHLITALVQSADKARLTGHPEMSRTDLADALALDPKNPIIAQHIDDLVTDRLRAIEETDENGVEVAPPVELTPAPGKKSFHIKGTGQDILRQVLSAYQITPVVDTPIQLPSLRLDADDVTYAEASQMVKMLTGTFFVPLDPQRVLVAKDTRENRQKYERLLVETIYLPGLTATELSDVGNIARNIFDAPVAVVQAQRNVLTVRAPERRMRALNATIADLLDGRAQVQLELRLYEVDKTRTTDVGIVLPQQSTVFNVQSELNSLIQNNQSLINQIISSGLAQPGDYAAILAILVASGQISNSILSQGFRTFGGGITQFGYTLGTISGNLALNSSDVRTIDEVKLRVQDQETGTFRAGTHYPIITSTYSAGTSSMNIPGVTSAGVSSALTGLGTSVAGLTTPQVTIPQIQYEDLGVTFKATPRIQHGQEITLNMDLKIEALGGGQINSIPILNNRQFTAVVTLKDGDSALVVSSLSRQESNAIAGIPGLNELPGLGGGTNTSKELDTTNLILLVTPHIVRKSHIEIAGREIMLPKHD